MLMGVFGVGEPSDEALLAGMATGDERASVEFVRRYQRRVFGLAYSMLGDADAAQDVAQEAMLRAWRHAQVFDARRGSVTTWVLSITRNLAIDALRLRRAVPMDPDHFGQLGLVSLAESPADRAVTASTIPKIRSALADLPVDQRRALVLAAVYGRTAVEIAEAESIPLGTAKTRIRAGLSKLRSAMAEERADHER
jgi:RNA polymerase sigma factor (sigma-70 family)